MKKIIREYNIMRVIAVLLVIIGHCSYYTISTKYGGEKYGGINYVLPDGAMVGTIDILTRKILTITNNLIYMFHMPLFIAISGALFEKEMSENKYKNIVEVIKKKSIRLLLPFIIVLFFYSTPIKYLTGYFNNVEGSKICNIFKGQILLQGNNYLWFLPTLFILFIISYFLNKINHKKRSSILIIVLVIFNIVSNFLNVFFLKYIFQYEIFFYFGEIFEKNRVKINTIIDKIARQKIILYCCILLIFMCIFEKVGLKNKIIIDSIIYFIRIIIGLLCCMLCYMFSYFYKYKKIFNTKIFEEINKYSFGLYLYSDPINYLLLFLFYKFYGIIFFYTNPGILIIFTTRLIVTSISALIISKILRKIGIKFIS